MIADDVGGFAEISFIFGLADADDRGDIVAEGGGDFLLDDFVGLVIEVAAFGMADDGIFDNTAKLISGNFAGVGAKIISGDVLRSEFNLALLLF